MLFVNSQVKKKWRNLHKCHNTHLKDCWKYCLLQSTRTDACSWNGYIIYIHNPSFVRNMSFTKVKIIVMELCFQPKIWFIFILYAYFTLLIKSDTVTVNNIWYYVFFYLNEYLNFKWGNIILVFKNGLRLGDHYNHC